MPAPRVTRDSLHDATVAPAPVVVTGRRRSALRQWYLPLEVLASTVVGVVTSFAVAPPARFAIVLVVLTVLTNYHLGEETVRPGLPHLSRIVRDAALPMLVVAIGVATRVLEPQRVTDALVIVGAMALTAVVATMSRRLLDGPVRMVVFGSADDAAKATARYAGDRRAKVVGAVLPAGSTDDGRFLTDTFGVDVVVGHDNSAHWLAAWQADLVTVAATSVTAEDIRRLCWELEGTSVSLAVMGVVDKVAPHRIDAAALAGGTLLHVRSSRPSTFVRAVKAGIDRVAGVLLLVLAAPLLVLLALAVRIDSRGPALFRQTRVGRDGAPFTMYKLRTMHRDAEARLAELAAHNEGNGVLFKIHDDPRVTRVGRLLRKTSLDELPQLLNVVLGEMSLVGPRPALPHEVAQYSPHERRRLAVRPGMTGLWQVSGRSNLSWEASVELDLHYADNWRLIDDLEIGARTVDAVVRPRGAY